MGDKYIKSGDGLTRKGHHLYRPWAAKSQNEGYIICTWCNSEYLATNATGKKGHEESIQHKKLDLQYGKVSESDNDLDMDDILNEEESENEY